jgi:hypothetical protein
MRSSARLTTVLAAVLALVALTGCGVGPQTTAEPLPSNIIPAPLPVATASPTTGPPTSPPPSPTAESSPTNSALLRLWFVQEDGLAAVESSLPAGSSADLVLQALAVGPTEQQLAEGLRTVAQDPVTGLALVSIAPPTVPASTPASAGPPASGSPADDGSVVPVMLSAAFSALPPAEQVLLLGQVVLSLTGAGASFVSFQDEAGSPVAVPLPDGRLLDTPATARDYGILITQP